MSEPSLSEISAVVLSSFDEGPVFTKRPFPTLIAGSLIAKVLYSSVLGYANDVYVTRKRPYPMQLPLTIGSSAIARVHSVGPDSTSFKPGELVLIDVFILGRDDPGVNFLFGLTEGMTEQSKKLMGEAWRDSTYATHARVPLENTYHLDEALLTSTLSLPLSSLCYIPRLCVPMGGLFDINLRPGETILVAPSTGNFGAAAVQVALALGATVIAAGRTASTLQTLVSILGSRAGGRLSTAIFTGKSVETDLASFSAAAGSRPIDAYIDFSPPSAAQSTHLKGGILAVRPGGRVSLMGGIGEDVSLPYREIMRRSLVLRGKFMYDREAVRKLIGMVESGVLGLQGVKMEEVPLSEWKKAFDLSEKNEFAGAERGVVVVPGA